MSEKSYVSMEQNMCEVCGQLFDTNSLLLDKRMRDSMEMHTVTGYGLCDEHQKLYDDDYVALVGVDEKKTTVSSNGNIQRENAWRTGKLAFLRRHVAAEIFDVALPEKGPMVFCPDEVIDRLETLQQRRNEMNKEIKDKWVSALRSGEYLQTQGGLHDEQGFCCLGVLVDILDPDHWVKASDDKVFGYPDKTETSRIEFSGLPVTIKQKAEMCSYLGAAKDRVALAYTGNHYHFALYNLAKLNDNDFSFKEIADVIDEHWEDL